MFSRIMELFEVVEVGDQWGYITLPSFCRVFAVDYLSQLKRLQEPSGYFSDKTKNKHLGEGPIDEIVPCLWIPAVPLFIAGMDSSDIMTVAGKELYNRFMNDIKTALNEGF